MPLSERYKMYHRGSAGGGLVRCGPGLAGAGPGRQPRGAAGDRGEHGNGNAAEMPDAGRFCGGNGVVNPDGLPLMARLPGLVCWRRR